MSDAMTNPTDWTIGFPALSFLDSATRERLRETGRRMALPAGTTIFQPGDPCQAWLLVETGSIRVQMTADTGRQVVLYRVSPGESCVLTTACLLGDELYAAEGITETESAGIAVPIPVFQELLDTSPDFRNIVFKSFGQRFTNILVTLEDVAFHRLDARLARLLLARARDDGLTATHQEIAMDLGSSREVVSRQLKSFERDGLVDLARGRIKVLDVAGLTRRAHDD